jgi:hypothetical protein
MNVDPSSWQPPLYSIFMVVLGAASGRNYHNPSCVFQPPPGVHGTKSEPQLLASLGSRCGNLNMAMATINFDPSQLRVAPKHLFWERLSFPCGNSSIVTYTLSKLQVAGWATKPRNDDTWHDLWNHQTLTEILRLNQWRTHNRRQNPGQNQHVLRFQWFQEPAKRNYRAQMWGLQMKPTISPLWHTQIYNQLYIYICKYVFIYIYSQAGICWWLTLVVCYSGDSVKAAFFVIIRYFTKWISVFWYVLCVFKMCIKNIAGKLDPFVVQIQNAET